MIQTYLKFDAEPAVVLAELSDLASWPDWWPGVRKATVLEDRPNAQVVELELSLVVNIKVTLELDLSQPNCIRFRQRRGWFRRYEGEWRLLPARGGRATTLRVTTDLTPRGLVPRSIVYSKLLGSLELAQERLARRLERKATAAAPAPTPAEAAAAPTEPRVLAHVFHTSRGPEMWIRGQRYLIRRAVESAVPAAPRS